MTPAICPDCRLRFTRAGAACFPCCPRCGGPVVPVADLAGAVGYRLFRPDDGPHAEPEAGDGAMPMAIAMAVSLPVPDPGVARS